LRKLGYRRVADRKRSSPFIDENDTIEGAPDLKTSTCRYSIVPSSRPTAFAAFLAGARDDDGGGPAVLVGGDQQDGQHAGDVTPQDIADAYFWGWELGLKAIAIYRDGSKQSQPLNTKKGDGTAAEAEVSTRRRSKRSSTSRVASDCPIPAKA
jgi:ribonucleoside-diphosphate reductase alpha chain